MKSILFIGIAGAMLLLSKKSVAQFNRNDQFKRKVTTQPKIADGTPAINPHDIKSGINIPLKIIPKPTPVFFPRIVKEFTVKNSNINKVNRIKSTAEMQTSLKWLYKPDSKIKFIPQQPTTFKTMSGTLGSENGQSKPLSSSGILNSEVKRKTGDNSSVIDYVSSPRASAKLGNTNVEYRLLNFNEAGKLEEDPEIRSKNVVKAAKTYNTTKKMDCASNTQIFNANSKNFMAAGADNKNIYLAPGMIYSFEDIIRGNLTQQKYNDASRNSITLFTDTYNANQVSAPVMQPNGSTIADAIKTIVNNFGDNPGGANTKIQIRYTENETKEKMLIAAGGSYMGASLNASYNKNDSRYHLYFTLDALKEMYTIGVLNDLGSFYQNNKIPDFNGETPLIVSNVTYGARVLANIDVSIDYSDADINVEAGYRDLGVSADVDFDKFSSKKNVTVEINGLLVGFPSRVNGGSPYFHFSFDRAVTEAFINNTLKTFFEKCDYTSAKPISYTLADMEGNQVGMSSLTDVNTCQECVPADHHFTLATAELEFNVGSIDKNVETEAWIELGMGAGAPFGNVNQLNSESVGIVHIPFGQALTNTHFSAPFELSKYPNIMDFAGDGGYLSFILATHDRDEGWSIDNLKLHLHFVSSKDPTLHFDKVLDLRQTSVFLSLEKNTGIPREIRRERFKDDPNEMHTMLSTSADQ
ncbi:MAG: hypothetical protein EKK37_00620 [Sphingobacteriales bacterium]|nr:MAG: hypothetical protein EKK37_00620 [Sphingobacteriales bacterium]